jgi:hypothetical protein
MPFSVNGVGTTFYGNAQEEPDGSYVVTEWVVLFFVPILPLGSKRVRPAQDTRPWWKRSVMGQHYQARKVPLHMPHLWKGYAVTIAVAVVLVLAVFVSELRR